MKKIITEFIVDKNNCEDGGLCTILSFNLPTDSGLSHGQFVSLDYPESEFDGKYPVLNSLRGKKVRITFEVIK